ncbi:MAG TPA: DUF2127 domain-containing protein [Candidatus Baltobacteraceae bacterium]|nr:DUF2127 domain-containing protein [Candidatus Baltobacteraceae bacterium]
MSSIEMRQTSAAHEHMKSAVLHESFRVSIMLKGLHAVLETILGIVLLKVAPQTLNRWAMSLLTQDFSQDPNDFVVTHLHRAFERMADGGSHFASWYLLSHGGVKLCLVLALLWNKLWAYPLMMAMLAAFIGYQTYRFALTHSPVMVALTLFDIVVIALTWIEYRQQLARRHRAVS